MVNITGQEASVLTVIAQNPKNWSEEECIKHCKTHDAKKIAFLMIGKKCRARKELVKMAKNIQEWAK
jgi:hypothetical protein